MSERFWATIAVGLMAGTATAALGCSDSGSNGGSAVSDASSDVLPLYRYDASNDDARSSQASDASDDALPVSAGDAGDGGSAHTALGQACAGDADCGGSLQCATSLGGGSPALGYCSIPCNRQLLNPTAPDVCAPLGSICDDFTPSAPTPDGWCMATCQVGPVLSASDKCKGRDETACVMVDPQRGLGICRPLCTDDTQCAGKKCDPSSGLCVAALPAPVNIGASCDPNANDCAFCLSLVDTTSGGQIETVASFCSGRCRLGTQGACAFGAAGLGGFCLLPADVSSDLGDVGYCAQLCDATADCADKTDGFVCNLATVSAIGHGYCDLGAGADAGPGSPVDAADAGASSDASGGVEAAAQ